MKRLEKILVIGGLIVGGSLLGLGFYLDSQLMRSSGILSLAYPAGVVLGKIIEEDDEKYLGKYKSVYPRQNNSQKDL